MPRDNPIRNRTRRYEREVRHNERALQEKSKMITGFQFINEIEIFFYGDGGFIKPHDNYIVYFILDQPVLIKDFEEKLKEKLKECMK